MLAEECRYRWFGIVENEGCIIDDISCIVIDFSKLNESLIGTIAGHEPMKKLNNGYKHLED